MSTDETLNMLRDGRALALNMQTDALLRIARSQLRWSVVYGAAFCVYLLVWLFAAQVLHRPTTLLTVLPACVFLGLCVMCFLQSSRTLRKAGAVLLRR